MKVSRVTICGTDVASFTTKMEGTMRALGRITRWTAMESSTMKVASLLMKVTGYRTNSTVWERSITITQYLWVAVSTIQILSSWKIIGNTMKACLFMIRNKVVARSSFLMMSYSKETSIMIAFKASANSIRKMARQLKGFGDNQNLLRWSTTWGLDIKIFPSIGFNIA